MENFFEKKDRWGELLEARPLQLNWWAAVRLAALIRLQSELRLEDPEDADALLSAVLDHLRPPYEWDAPEEYERFGEDVARELRALRGEA